MSDDKKSDGLVSVSTEIAPSSFQEAIDQAETETKPAPVRRTPVRRLRGVYHYITDSDGNPVPCVDITEWGDWHSKIENRRVGWTKIGNDIVSTVFIGIDLGFNLGFHELPILWETMVSRNEEWDEQQWRYSSLAEAVAGHEAVCAYVRGEGPRP